MISFDTPHHSINAHHSPVARYPDDLWHVMEPIRQAGQKKLAMLSPRELDVLQCVAVGDPNKEIAAQLNISVKTVEKNRSRMMRKLKIKSFPDQMRIWLQAHPHELKSGLNQRENVRVD